MERKQLLKKITELLQEYEKTHPSEDEEHIMCEIFFYDDPEGLNVFWGDHFEETFRVSTEYFPINEGKEN